MDDRASASYCLAFLDLSRGARKGAAEGDALQDAVPGGAWSYQAKLGREPITLEYVEFRILKLLASRPYHAFTRRTIAESISSDRNPVSEDSIEGHVATLRDKLGFFADYIQSVPYIGYRFRE